MVSQGFQRRPPIDSSTRQLQDIISDPVRFSHGILGYDTWEIPNQILRALSKPFARVAVKSCHASGKTFTGGLGVPWFMTRYTDSIVVTTAPTWIQVRDLLWKEIHTSISQAKIAYPDANNTDWRWNEEHYAIGVSTTEADRFQGFHAPHVLIIVDEASGVRQTIFDAIEGISAGGDVRILLLGNPTIATGTFFRAFGRENNEWQTFTIDAFDTPNFKDVPGRYWNEMLNYLLECEKGEHEGPEYLDENPWPFLITRRWVVQRYHEWGVESPLWQARVRGQFPTKSEFSLISLEWVEKMKYNENRMPGGTRVLGVDVARYGVNFTSYVHMSGNVLDGIQKVQGRDTVDCFNRIREYVLADHDLVVVVDDSGVGGGVVDMCRAHNVPVTAFNAANKVLLNEDTANRGSEAYWDLSIALRDGEIALGEGILSDYINELETQLIQIEYKFGAQNRIQVAKTGLKDDKPSPDLADAFNLANTARRRASNRPESVSAQVPPLSGLSTDISDLFKGKGGGRLNLSADRSSLSTPPQQNPMEILTSFLCPRCRQAGTLKELGRVVNIRKYQFRCRGCGYEEIVNQTVNGK